MVARRVSRVTSPPRAQQTSRPPQRGGGWGMAGQSCLRSAALQFPNLPGEGSGEQGRSSRLGSAEAPKPPRSRSCPERDGASPGGKEEAQVHRSVPPLSSCLSGQAPQETGPLFLSATWGIYIQIFLICFVLPDFFPPSCGFAVDRGERLSVRAPTAPPEKPGSDFPSEKRESERARKGNEPVGAEPAAPERGGGRARGLR